ncbi:MAG TPA: RsmD family RNA methyltransferase [Acidimicrobiales bacterium]|nr:RsmD family RNA methyltransferase [Acidimicrobiales bacterium]
MRVIAGEMGGRRLLAPPGRGTRPTSDRVREAAFSMLESLGVLEGARVWDLFAGSGAMGIEALSRGATQVAFVDHAAGPVSAIRDNLARLGYGPPRATVFRDDALRWASSQASGPAHHTQREGPEAPAVSRVGPAGRVGRVGVVDLVTADPPYAWHGWEELFALLAPLEPVVLAETGDNLVLPPGWQALRSKRYGGSVITLARSSGTVT